MQPHILQTKLKPPRVAPDILPRARLLDMLNQGRGLTLNLISAPAGYGKSTLACHWVMGSDFPVGWISLDKSDSDLLVFLSYFLAAVQSLFPQTKLETEVFLGSDQKPLVNDLARYLLNDLDQISEPFILVLDDYQHIAGSSSVHDLLGEVLAHPTRTMHLVLLTRRDPPFSLSRLRGNGQLMEIRTSDLRFTPAEVSVFFNEKLKIPLDGATVRLLDEKMEGWVTGLRLAGFYLRKKDDLENRVRELSGGMSNIAEYLFEEVLSQQSPAVSAFLFESSILDRFCVPLCEALHSRRIEEEIGEQDFDVQQLIKRMVNANLFVIPLDDEDNWFRYHHLVQDFLQNRLRKQSNADTIAGLHLRASNWFADSGLIDEAIRHALAAGDTQAAVRLVRQHRYELLNNAQYCRLNNWLLLLPTDSVAEMPLFVTTQAINSLQNGQVEDVCTYTEQAQRMLTEIPPDSAEYPALQGEIATLTGVVKAMAGQPAPAFVAAQKSLELLPRQALFIRSLALAVMAVCSQMEGNSSLGVKLLRDELKNSGITSSIQARICFYLCLVNFLDINASGVLHWGRKALLLAEGSLLAHTRGGVQYFLGAVHYQRNELTEAKAHLLGLLGSRSVANVVYVVQARGILAFLYLSEGSPEEAVNVIDQVDKNSWEMQDNYSPAIRQALRVELALRQGKVDEARRLSMGVDFNRLPPIWMLYVPQLTFIKLLMVEGTDQSLKEAHNRLVELDEQMGRMNRKNVRIEILGLMAVVCHKSGNEAAALEHLQSALDLAEPGGWIRNFSDLGAPMLNLLERLDHVKPAHTYAQQVLDACRADAARQTASDRAAEKTSSIAGQAAAPILSNREIEILHLLAEGLTNKEIASNLFISAETVKTHLQNIYRKLDAKGGRVAALKMARKLGLVAPD